MERATLKQHDCLMLRAALTLGFFSFLWVGKFSMKNRNLNPRFHPTMQDISWSREGMQSSRKLTEWAEVPPFYLAYTPMHVSSGSNGDLYGMMLQLFSHSAPLFHYRNGTGRHSQPCSFLNLPTPDRAMWLRCSQIQYTVCAFVLPGQASLQTLFRSWSDGEAQHTRHIPVTYCLTHQTPSNLYPLVCTHA